MRPRYKKVKKKIAWTMECTLLNSDISMKPVSMISTAG
jgi:hypothetical protein